MRLASASAKELQNAILQMVNIGYLAFFDAKELERAHQISRV
jgi:hypothetical protein